MNKRSKIGILILIIIMISLPIASFFVIPEFGPRKMTYFTLNIGSEWYFQSSNNETTWETKRYIPDDYEFIHGVFGTFCIYWSRAEKFPEDTEFEWVDQMWISKSVNKIIWWGYEDQNAKIIVDKGLIYVTEPVEQGISHSGKSAGTLKIKNTPMQTMQVEFQGNYTIEAIESIVTPAGTFTNCIKVHEQEITPDGNADFFVWYAPNIGAVKYYFPDVNQTDVLTEFINEPDNDPWDNWPMPYVPLLVVSTISTISVTSVLIIVVVILDRRANKKINHKLQ